MEHKKEKIFELYGRPAAIQKYSSNEDFVEVLYTKDKNSIKIVLDKTISTIKYIFIDYNMAQSIEDQKT